MVYEVRVAADAEGLDRTFELKREEPLKEGNFFMHQNLIYRVRRVLPGNDDYDAILEVAQVGGPTETWYGQAK